MKGGVAVALALAVELTDPVVDVTWIFYDNEEVDSDLNGLGRLPANAARPARGRLRDPGRAHQRHGRGGLQRHPARRGAHQRQARALRPVVDGRQRHPRPRPGIRRAAELRAAERRGRRPGLSRGAQRRGGRRRRGGQRDPGRRQARRQLPVRAEPGRGGGDRTSSRRVFPGMEVVVTDLAEGARPGLDDPLAQAFVAAVGGPATPKYGWTDVARFAALGIPAVNYGPGDPNLAHADDERVPVDQIESVARGLRAWLTGALSPAPRLTWLRVRYRLTPWWVKVLVVFVLSRVVTTAILLDFAARQPAERVDRRAPGLLPVREDLGRALVLHRRGGRLPGRAADHRRRPRRRERMGVHARVPGGGPAVHARHRARLRDRRPDRRDPVRPRCRAAVLQGDRARAARVGRAVLGRAALRRAALADPAGLVRGVDAAVPARRSRCCCSCSATTGCCCRSSR